MFEERGRDVRDAWGDGTYVDGGRPTATTAIRDRDASRDGGGGR